jgi:L-threonylcarbamoyladenylate synthase
MPTPMLTIASATAAMRRGEVVAYPTETFYALGAATTSEEGLARALELKARDEGKPLSLILGRAEMLASLAHHITPPIVKLISMAWPGPLTIVLEARRTVSELITGGTGTVAVRVPSHPQARALADAIGGAITATSANRQGQPPPTDAGGVENELGGSGLAGIVSGQKTPGGTPTTLVRPEGRRLVVLRPGVVSTDVLRQWWPDIVC